MSTMVQRICVTAAVTFAAMTGCERTPTSPQPPTSVTSGGVADAGATDAAGVEPVVERPWGETTEQVPYEIRSLPSGDPGLFTGEGKLLLELLPAVETTAHAVGKGEVPPTRHDVELIKLAPIVGGGFSLYGRAEDKNGRYDLRIEKGPGDPRVRVSLSTTWNRDVVITSQMLWFRTGRLEGMVLPTDGGATQPVDAEGRVAAPMPLVGWVGEEELAVWGRTAVESLNVRASRRGSWRIGAAAVDVPDDSDGEARAAGRVDDLRIDFVLGPFAPPVATGTAEDGAVDLEFFPDGVVRVTTEEERPVSLRLPQGVATTRGAAPGGVYSIEAGVGARRIALRTSEGAPHVIARPASVDIVR